MNRLLMSLFEDIHFDMNVLLLSLLFHIEV